VREEGFFSLGNSALLGIPTPVWITVSCFLVFGFLLRSTTFGRNTLATGGNQEAARLAGIAVDRLKMIIFSAQGLMAGFAGVVLASRMTSGQPTTAMGFVVAGVLLMGTVQNAMNLLNVPPGFVVAGVLLMGTVQNAMNLLNVPPFYQYVARGAILLGAVLFDRFKQGRAVG